MRFLPLRWRLLAALVMPLMLAACGPREQPLRIATHPWIGYEPLCLAQELGALPPGVRLVHGQRSADTMAALRAGSVEAGALTLDEVLQVRAAGTPLTVVLVFDSSSGADVLLARPGIQGLRGLAGKRVGYEPTAVGALLLSEVMTQAGLGPDELTRVELPLTDQLDAWRRGHIDALVTYEPMAAQVQAEGAVRLFDSRQMPDTIFDVLAVRSDRLDGREDALRQAIQTHFRMLAYLHSNREDAVYRIAAHQGLTADDVRRALAGVALPDLAGNRYALQPDSRFAAAARRVHALMLQRGMLARPDPLTDLFRTEYLPVSAAMQP